MCLRNLQFEDEAFDVVVDKGGLDALMEPELGPKLGTQYLSEVSLFFFLFCFKKHVVNKYVSVVMECGNCLFNGIVFEFFR